MAYRLLGSAREADGAVQETGCAAPPTHPHRLDHPQLDAGPARRAVTLTKALRPSSFPRPRPHAIVAGNMRLLTFFVASPRDDSA